MRKSHYFFAIIVACIIPLLGWQSYSLIEKQIQMALFETLNTTLKLTK